MLLAYSQKSKVFYSFSIHPIAYDMSILDERYWMKLVIYDWSSNL